MLEEEKTTYMCKQCTLLMCVVPCFELYHTKVDPQIPVDYICMLEYSLLLQYKLQLKFMQHIELIMSSMC